ncbi:unnamed protein product [Didymodactylos carnosus]|uniref:Uncharacterized protein n=1 Tax=Didymodactylos carnosus TaxID=1234261 RepID=A0A816B9A3_9BILA|nr:unnamed protein product [Didymodactylos carnosus]CAF4485943.1 unnamed protein product [Didymodactylos carnosus]
MKSADVRSIVLRKHQNEDTPTKIFRDLSWTVLLRTLKRWMKMINNSGSFNLSTPPGPTRTIRTTSIITKVKQRMARKKRTSARKIAKELDISKRSVGRILHQDLAYFPYKMITEPAITDLQKQERAEFAY